MSRSAGFSQILVVDDEDAVRSVVGTILRSAGMEVVEADSAATALRIFAVGGADLVISDINMPLENGIALAARLRHLQAGVPVLFMTGGPIPEIELDQRTALLRKPFPPAELIAKATALLRTRSV